MAKSYEIGKSKEGIKEIKEKIDNKKGEISQLEQQKKELLNAFTEIGDAKLDDKVIRTIEQSINRSLEENKQKGLEISYEIGDELKKIEDIKQESLEGLNDASYQKSSLERKKKLLDRFGIGSALDSATGELNENIKELEEIKDDSIEVMRELEQISHKASGL